VDVLVPEKHPGDGGSSLGFFVGASWVVCTSSLAISVLSSSLPLLNDKANAGLGRWHICTGIGAYIFIAVIDHLVSGDDHRDIPGSLAWPAPWAAQSVFAGKGSDKKQA
jgi:hypothetical protein